MQKKLWTREELVLVFNLYLKLPFGKLHTRTSEVIEMAELIDRSVNSIAIRLTNFAACDPYHQNRGIKGMIGGIKQCQPIWDEFSENRGALNFESEKILAEKVDELHKVAKALLTYETLSGEEIKKIVFENIYPKRLTGNEEVNTTKKKLGSVLGTIGLKPNPQS